MNSRIVNDITYDESDTIQQEDIYHQSQLFVMKLFDTEITCSLGKLDDKYYNSNGIFVINLYGIRLNEQESASSTDTEDIKRIGVIEMNVNVMKQIIKNNDIDIDNLPEPLLFSGVNKTSVQKFKYDKDVDIKKVLDNRGDSATTLAQEKKLPTSAEVSVENNVMETIQNNSSRVLRDILSKFEQEKISEAEKNNLGLIYDNKTSSSTRKMTEEEITTTQKPWISILYNDRGFQIQPIPGDGDCFYTSLVESIKQKFPELDVDVQSLRYLASKNTSIDTYNNMVTVYNGLQGELKKIKKDITTTKNNYNEIVKNINKVNEVLEKAHITEDKIEKIKERKDKYPKHYKIIMKKESLEKDKNEIKKVYNSYRNKVIQTERNLNEIKAIHGENNKAVSFEEYKNRIVTTKEWADENTVSILERMLNIKLIIIRKENISSFVSREKPIAKITCGSVSGDIQSYSPYYYVMLEYSGNHYQVIKYQGKTMFRMNELPYSVLKDVEETCARRRGGLFSKIPEFRYFIEEDKKANETPDSDSSIDSSLDSTSSSDSSIDSSLGSTE